MALLDVQSTSKRCRKPAHQPDLSAANCRRAWATCCCWQEPLPRSSAPSPAATTGGRACGPRGAWPMSIRCRTAPGTARSPTPPGMPGTARTKAVSPPPAPRRPSASGPPPRKPAGPSCGACRASRLERSRCPLLRRPSAAAVARRPRRASWRPIETRRRPRRAAAWPKVGPRAPWRRRSGARWRGRPPSRTCSAGRPRCGCPAAAKRSGAPRRPCTTCGRT
mmetsp:Transcript_90485/g.230139  ORF Transcript_90485/g.230139 Transcript_90485/m.230139 type:complete len:222 (+) Transcript_90485:702-1367(+)